MPPSETIQHQLLQSGSVSSTTDLCSCHSVWNLNGRDVLTPQRPAPLFSLDDQLTQFISYSCIKCPTTISLFQEIIVSYSGYPEYSQHSFQKSHLYCLQVFLNVCCCNAYIYLHSWLMLFMSAVHCSVYLLNAWLQVSNQRENALLQLQESIGQPDGFTGHWDREKCQYICGFNGHWDREKYEYICGYCGTCVSGYGVRFPLDLSAHI